MKNKNTLKILDKAIELAKLLIDLQILKNGHDFNDSDFDKPKQGHVPDYRERKKGAIVNDKKQEYVINKNSSVSNFQKLWDETKPDFLKEKESDFHKGMLDADKELQRVCKEIIFVKDVENGPGYLDTNDFMYWESNCPNCNSENSITFDLQDKETDCSECNKKYKMQYLNCHKVILSKI